VNRAGDGFHSFVVSPDLHVSCRFDIVALHYSLNFYFTTENVFPTKVNFMAQFRRFSAHFTPEQAEKEAVHASRREKLASFAHERLHAGGNSALLCLSASVEEVSVYVFMRCINHVCVFFLVLLML